LTIKGRFRRSEKSIASMQGWSDTWRNIDENL
jgi:hypothetical protein